MSDTKPQSKRQQLRKLLSRKSGARASNLQKHFGWQPHTIRAEISRLRKTGAEVTCTPSANGAVYKIRRPDAPE